MLGGSRKEANSTGVPPALYRAGLRKSLGKANWYKNKRKAEDQADGMTSPTKSRRLNLGEKIQNEQETIEWNTVMFVPYTWDGGLVKDLRAVETKMGPLTGWRIKFVERAGVKMVDMLHKADPWQGADCERDRCKLCKTKQKKEKIQPNPAQKDQ